MTQTPKQSTRLMVNTVVSFLPMGMTIVFGLLGTSLLVGKLGLVDFGLLGALGATGAMLEFIKNALTASSQRHFAYEIGVKNWDKLSRVFYASWVLFTLLGIGLWIIAACLGPFILSMLQIPAERADAAWWVYHLSLLSVVLTFWVTPYRAMLFAQQNITLLSTAQGTLTILKFVAILLLFVVPWDLMISFMAIRLLFFLLIQVFIAVWCITKHQSCQFKTSLFEWCELKRVLHFAGWNMLENLSHNLRTQGGTLLITSYFGPIVNAAYTIALQAVTIIFGCTAAFCNVVHPVIVGAEARNDRAMVHRMTLVSSKYLALIFSFGLIPIFIESEQLLTHWLPTIPPFTLILTRLSIVWMFINTFFTGHVLALHGTGNIGWYSRSVLALRVTAMVAAGVGFAYGAPVWCLPFALIIDILILLVVAIVGIGREVDLSPKEWLKKTLAPIAIVTLPATAAAALVFFFMPPTLLRAGLVAVVYAIVAAPIIWFMGLEPWERDQFGRVFGTAINRIKRKKEQA